jgi:hypothetical protein
MKLGIAWLLVAVLGIAPSLWSQEGGVYRWTRVSYAQGGVVAIDAGDADGVRRWTRLEIVRHGVPVALLVVSSLGDHQARCNLVSRGAGTVALAAGDSVRFIPVRQPGAQPLATTPAAPASGAAPPVAVRPPPRAPDSTKTQTSSATPTPVTQAAPAPQPVASSPPAPPSAPTQQATPGKPRVARVTFLTTASVYVDAGTSEGLVEGSRVDVLHGGTSVAELKVAFVSSHQASCQVVSKSAALAVGDSVRFTAVVASGASDSSATLAAARRARAQAPATTRRSDYGRLRGRIGLYYLTVQQQDSFGGRYSQPSGDIRLTGSGLGGTALGLVADLRTRRLVQALPGSPNSSTDQTRVYQALLYWQSPGSPLRFTTGRQYAPAITSVGLIDGGAVELSQQAWDYGVFGGMSPDPVSLGFSGDSLTQLGGYIRRHNRLGSLSHWSLTAGVSGSYASWHTNREFFYAQGNYQSRRLSLYAVQEIDYYRFWRRVGTNEKMLSPTSTFANVQYQVTDAVSVNAGIDNRRNVRLYYYVINPAILFDDTFRRGVWAGAAAHVVGHFQVAFDARTNHDNTNGDANTYTLGLGADRVTPIGLSLRSRSTRYTVGPRQGWLNSVTLGVEPFGRSSIQLTSGWRTEHDTSTAPTLNMRWLSADIDVSLARSLFVILSAYRERGGIQAHDLLYSGLSYRF